jgi:CheY-like chemotaxis protein
MMRPDQAYDEHDRPESAAQPTAAPEILLVDDQALILALTSDLLRAAGFRVATVNGGAEALVAARTSHPAAILLDVEMPGLNGFETCRRLKADPATATIPVALFTASQDPHLTHEAYAAGAEGTIPKSVNAERLAHAVRILTTARLHRPEPAGVPAT